MLKYDGISDAGCILSDGLIDPFIYDVTPGGKLGSIDCPSVNRVSIVGTVICKMLYSWR